MRIDWLKWLALSLLAVILAVGTGVVIVARASLPRRDGEAAIPRLAAPLAIDLDAHAVPRIHGTTFEDVLRGEGYMHAQERFFQMDLLRVLALDRAQRPFDFRRRARELLTRLPPREQGWLAAYTDGVNAGLADLRSRPPEYWLLGSRPDAWRAEDTLLVVLGFYTRLSNNDVYERPQGVLHAALPEALYQFLTPSTSRFDRPLVGADSDPTAGYVPAPIPGPEVVDLRTRSAPSRGPARRVAPPLWSRASTTLRKLTTAAVARPAFSPAAANPSGSGRDDSTRKSAASDSPACCETPWRTRSVKNVTALIAPTAIANVSLRNGSLPSVVT